MNKALIRAVLAVLMLHSTASRTMQAQETTFEMLWLLGNDDDSQAEFSQENTAQNPPGSATAQDDDYYFSGNYPAPIGVVTADEPTLNYDRALTGGDPRNRIHFVLNEADADAFNQYRLNLEIIGSNALPIPFKVRWNDTQVLDVIHEADPAVYSATFSGSDVASKVGENIVTIERPSGSGWIQFDYVSLEIRRALKELIQSFSANPKSVHSGDAVLLTWNVDPAASISINEGVGNVDNLTQGGIGSAEVKPARSTTYTLTATKNGVSETASVNVIASILRDFQADSMEVIPGASIRLSWNVDPESSVSIEPTIGDANSFTVNGVGQVELTPQNQEPGSINQYTLTATKLGQVETATVEVVVDLRFTDLWTVGIDNGTVSEFSQENTSQDPPGSPLLQDDDYYVAGDYGGEIGLLSENEALVNFDRALTAGDPRNRIHFTLDSNQAKASSQYRVTVDTIINSENQTFTVSWNDHQIMTGETFDGVDQTFSTIVSASDVGAKEGQNTLTMEGTVIGGWIGFDYISAEVLAHASNQVLNLFTSGERIIPPGGSSLLKWEVTPGATVSIDNGIGDVSGLTQNGTGSVSVSPSQTTTYTLTATNGGVTETGSVQLLVRLLSSFEADKRIIEPGQSVTLTWAVGPGASVSIDQGIGNVDGMTNNGIGSIQVTPSESTTYTLTVSRGNQSERATVMVDIDFGFELLWQVGIDNNTNSEFSQENESQDPPGSPELQDDDYYFAGDYGGDIGIIEQDEDSLNFDRALTSGDPRNRIHFILTPEQAGAANLFKITLDTIGNEGGHPFTVSWNDNPVYSDSTTGVNAEYVGIFSASDAGAVPGPNTVTIERGGSGGWIQFDYIRTDLVLNFLELSLREAGIDSESGKFKFSWKSEIGKVYNIEVSDDLLTWSILVEGYPTGGSVGALTSYLESDFSTSNPAKYYRVVNLPPEALYSEDFESGPQGWTVGSLNPVSPTVWELGTPVNGPGSANSGRNAYGTDLDADYEFDTHIYLRSPVIDLTRVQAATLQYYNYRDVEPLFEGLFVDWIEINLLDENGNPLLNEPLKRLAGSNRAWRQEKARIPEEGIGKKVRIEFTFVSDNFNAFDPETGAEITQAGWFIDDVEVIPE